MWISGRLGDSARSGWSFGFRRGRAADGRSVYFMDFDRLATRAVISADVSGLGDLDLGGGCSETPGWLYAIRFAYGNVFLKVQLIASCCIQWAIAIRTK